MGVVLGRLGELWAQTGDAAAFTTEACTQVSGTTYKITSASKRQWDRATAVTCFDGGTPITSFTAQYPIGRLVLGSAPSGAVTVTGKYWTMAQVGYVRGWKLNLKTGLFDTTSLGDTARSFMPTGLIDWSGSFERFYEDSTWADLAMSASGIVLFKLYEDEPSDRVWCGYGSIGSWDGTVNVEELIKENISFNGLDDVYYITSET